MRLPIRSLILGFAVSAVLAAAGASAQSRPSLSDRVTALETRVQQAQTEQSVEQLNRITQIEADVKALRAVVEQMQNEQQQARDHEKAQYVDLDTRLSRLENAAAQAPPPATAKPSAAAKTPAVRVAVPVQAKPSMPPPAAAIAPPAAGSPAASPAGSGDTAGPVTEQAGYDAALAAFRADQYADSAQRFNAFLQQYPDSQLASNAYYWMGESYYGTQNYQAALDAFQIVVSRFENSPKMPGALLKLGYSQDALKQRDAAQATLRAVIQKFPNTDEAKQAASRLRAMSMDASG